MCLIVVCVVFQSIFGVGVLLFGTPLLLLNDLSFEDVLTLLLPVSISISVVQVLANRRLIKGTDFGKFFSLCLPALIFGLSLILFLQIDPTLFVVSALLLAISLRLEFLRHVRHRLARYKDFLMPLIGLVHGISNLGGSLLVIWASASVNEKLQVRTSIAFFYVFLATSQLVLLAVKTGVLTMPVIYLIVSVPMHLFSSVFLFGRLKEDVFQTLLTCLMFVLASLLLLKYFSVV